MLTSKPRFPLLPALLSLSTLGALVGCMASEPDYLRTEESITQTLAGLADDSVVVLHEEKYRVDWYYDEMDEFSKRTLIHSRIRTRGLAGASRKSVEYDIPTGFQSRFLRGDNLYFNDEGRDKVQRLNLKTGKTTATSFKVYDLMNISGDDGLAFQCTDQREFTLLRQGKTFKLPNLESSGRGTYCPNYRIFTRDGQWYLYQSPDASANGEREGLIVHPDGSHEPFILPEGLIGSSHIRGIGDVPFGPDFLVPAFFDPTGRIAESFRKVAAQAGNTYVGQGTEVDPVQGFWKTYAEVRDLQTGESLFRGSY